MQGGLQGWEGLLGSIPKGLEGIQRSRQPSLGLPGRAARLSSPILPAQHKLPSPCPFVPLVLPQALSSPLSSLHGSRCVPSAAETPQLLHLRCEVAGALLACGQTGGEPPLKALYSYQCIWRMLMRRKPATLPPRMHMSSLQGYWRINAWALIAIGIAQAVAGVTATLFFSHKDSSGENGPLNAALVATLF